MASRKSYGKNKEKTTRSSEMKKEIEILKRGGIGVLPTDTIYGIVGLALNKSVVERIYRIKGRNPKKPLIILISNSSELNLFEIEMNDFVKDKLKELWPGKVSVILKTKSGKEYLHRGTNTLAFRMPAKKELIEILKNTGPLVAPSANPEGKLPAKNIQEAKKYFGDKIDFYIDEGEISGTPSKIVDLTDGIKIIRG